MFRRACPNAPSGLAASHELLRSQSGYNCGAGSSSPALFHISREDMSICGILLKLFARLGPRADGCGSLSFVQCSTVRNERILEEATSSLARDPQLRRHPRHGLQHVRTQEIRTITDACQGDLHFQKPDVVSLLTSDGLSSIAVGLRGRCSVSDGSFKSDSCWCRLFSVLPTRTIFRWRIMSEFISYESTGSRAVPSMPSTESHHA